MYSSKHEMLMEGCKVGTRRRVVIGFAYIRPALASQSYIWNTTTCIITLNKSGTMHGYMHEGAPRWVTI